MLGPWNWTDTDGIIIGADTGADGEWGPKSKSASKVDFLGSFSFDGMR